MTFATEANVLVIGLNCYYSPPLYPFFWVRGSACYSGDVTVPVGATVEWVNYLLTAHLASRSVPAGGAPFDSGTLEELDRFQFVPTVAGTWEYADQSSGATGTITAR